MKKKTFTPHMTDDERSLFERCIPEKCRVIEFGSGGSTQLFFEKGAELVYSIESDKKWIDMLSTNSLIAESLSLGKWRPLVADIGKTKEWGVPANKKNMLNWLNYHQYCWDHIPDNSFDFVLIDGRFRVACLCQALIRCSHDNMVIAFHDFWNREAYHVMLKYVDVVDRVDTLAIFKPKKDLNFRALAITLLENQFNYS